MTLRKQVFNTDDGETFVELDKHEHVVAVYGIDARGDEVSAPLAEITRWGNTVSVSTSHNKGYLLIDRVIV